MQKKVTFKLNAQETKLADALRRQLQAETGAVISLEDIIKRHFVNWMYNNLIKPSDGEADGGVQAEVTGDGAEAQAATGGDALEQSPESSPS